MISCSAPILRKGEIAGAGGAGARRSISDGSTPKILKSLVPVSGNCPREAQALALEPAQRTDIYDTYVYMGGRIRELDMCVIWESGIRESGIWAVWV